MSLTYITYVQRLANAIQKMQADVEFSIVIPGAIDYAEQRCYRDLDLLSTVTRDASAQTTLGSRDFTLPSSVGRFVVTNGINIITPAATTPANSGTRNRLTPVSLDYLDFVWPSTTGTDVPVVYAMVTDQTVSFGPAPDAAYYVEVIGTIRPTPLSSANTTTYLTLYLPDLFLEASLIYVANELAPQIAQLHEAQYATLIGSANIEEQRKRYASGAWGSLQPTTIATPGR